MEELEDGQSYVCSCNNENFKKVEYNTTSQPLANLTLSNKTSNRISKFYRPSSPLKNGSSGLTVNSAVSVGGNIGTNISAGSGAASVGGYATNGSPVLTKTNERDSVVHPRIVTLIRNGTKPRKVQEHNDLRKVKLHTTIISCFSSLCVCY